MVLVRFYLNLPYYKNGDLIEISERVLSDPVRYASYQSVNVGGLKAYLPLFPEINYGDSVTVRGIVENGKLKQPKLVLMEKTKGIFYTLRQKLIAVYRSSLPEPHASLIAGITIGSKSGLPTSFWEALKATGTAHVVVASGMNVTFVAGFLLNVFLAFLSRKKAVVLSLIGIWMYVALSGFDAPLIRAAIMGSVMFFGMTMGRLYSAWRALVLSALVMLIAKPSWITDLGFILSFVATFSLMLFNRKVSKLVKVFPGVIREGLSTSLSAQIGVAPIIYVTFGQFNLFSPIINALVLWTVAPIMVIGAVGGLVGLIVPEVARLILYLAYPLTAWFVFVVGGAN